MKKVLLLCGGRTGEHAVSLLSAKTILDNLLQDEYKLIPVGITQKEGRWVTGDPFLENEDDPVKIQLARGLQSVWLEDGHVNGEKIDIIFSVVHGSYGEDGCLQGLYELQNIPYVGSGVMASAVSMDKDITKRLLEHAGIPCVRSVTLYDWQKPVPSFDEITKKWDVDTLFVKPCSQGSSLGISKCVTEEEYKEALIYAFSYDRKILIEEAVQAQEVEVAVIGNESPIASVPGEIVVPGSFYSYDKKYVDKDKNQIFIPAHLDLHIQEKLSAVAKQVFAVLQLSGLARVDFFVDRNKRYFVNEVNTLPGFTAASMYPLLMKHTGYKFNDWITELINLGFDQFEKKSKLKKAI